MIDPRILSVDPVRPPILKKIPAGRPYDFFELVNDSGMRNVITTSSPPDIRIHAGDTDFKTPFPGKVIYCLSGPSLPMDKTDRAREILRRLAYGYHDWAAREVVSRYHRDIKRAQTKTTETKQGVLPASVRIRRYLRSHPGASVGEIAASTDIAQPNVSRTLSQWQASKTVRLEKHGRAVLCFLVDAPEEALGTEPLSPTPR